MNLEEEKRELAKLVLDLNDVNLLMEIKALIDGHFKAKETSVEINLFYENFRQSVREIKQDKAGRDHLKDAKDWLNEL